MSTLKGRLLAAGSALVLAASAVSISLVGGGAADATVTGPTAVAAATAACPVPKTACYPLAANSLASAQAVNNSLASIDIKDEDLTTVDIKNGTLTKNDLSAPLYAALFDVPANGVNSSAKIKDGVITLADLDAALQAQINKTGPSYAANWGEIFRNTEGNARAELGQSSSGEGLTFSVPTGTDKVDFGNEADFAGKPVSLTAVKYEVFTTGENAALGNNMPSIKFEISNPATGATYTTLVYAPANSTANTWTTVDAKADTGNHWGFTGTYFNTGTDRCGLNGARCTLTEALSKLGDSAKFISASVGKGKDYAFHGAVRSLTINGTTYQFTAGGVLKN